MKLLAINFSSAKPSCVASRLLVSGLLVSGLRASGLRACSVIRSSFYTFTVLTLVVPALCLADEADGYFESYDVTEPIVHSSIPNFAKADSTGPTSSTGLSADVAAASILTDKNGDGTVRIGCVGDSITRGTGDGNAPGEEIETLVQPTGEAGYPFRIELALKVPVLNSGVPGQVFSTDGLSRFSRLVQSQPSDIFIVSGGANDSQLFTTVGAISRSAQTMINMIRALGRTPMLMTIPPICCNRVQFRGLTAQYNEEYRALASINQVKLANVEKGFVNTCKDDKCFLLNLPEGLHPNTAGYDVMAEVVSASILNIDLFAPDGPTLLAQALGRAPGSIRTKPDPVATPPPAPATTATTTSNTPS